MMRSSTPRRFTGWHMTGILVAFFAVVIAVNMLMATLAVRSFGGVVVDNSYVASQKFNGWLKAARAQEAQGWRETITIDAQRRVHVSLADAAGTPLTSVGITATAAHPLGRAPDIALSFREVAPGRYSADRALPAGRWVLHLTARQDAADHRYVREID
ncbi:integral membrane protein linked to a cation pump [Sphingobium sp. Ant17]|nr:FixH family protein [Sphingobium sp. Ant17]EXS68443.1 integral membrane protein linked to a cation pump [Sphingobium sp. Ant17]